MRFFNKTLFYENFFKRKKNFAKYGLQFCCSKELHTLKIKNIQTRGGV
tara:strand:+ start:3678 stop:3821 length:144 start_codon:yes stop_codon:yes gene_type:complete